MPAWSAAGTTNLSSGERLAVLLATDASITGALQGFTFSAQPVPIALTIVVNSAESVTLQASADNVNWVPVTSQGVAVAATTNTAETFKVSSGLYYRLITGGATTLGDTIWVAR